MSLRKLNYYKYYTISNGFLMRYVKVFSYNNRKFIFAVDPWTDSKILISSSERVIFIRENVFDL